MLNQKISFINSRPLELFRYENNDTRTSLIISAEHVQHRKHIERSIYRGAIAEHSMKFCLCNVNFDNCYTAVNNTSAVLKVFEKRQFSNGAQSISLKMDHERLESLYVFSRIAKTNDDKKIVEVGLSNKENGVTVSQFMHIGYVNAFQSAFLIVHEKVSHTLMNF